MARPMGNKYGNFLESSREGRMFNRVRMLESCRPNAFPTGTKVFPWMIPDAWFEEPDPPLHRQFRITDKYGLLCKSELNYALCVNMIANRIPACRIFDNRSDLSPPEETPDEEKHADDQEFRTNFRRFEERAAELKESLKSADIVGLDSEGGAEGGFKVLVFQTAEIDDEILRLLLTTCELPPPTEPPTNLDEYRRRHSYLFVEDSTKPLQSYRMPTTQEMIGSLPASPFKGKSMEDIFRIWESIIEPVKECRSLVATHCFVVLDKWTEGSNTVVVVTPWIERREGLYYAGYTSRRASFPVLAKGLLKGLEMLMVDLKMLEVVDDCVVVGRAWGWDPADEDGIDIDVADEHEENTAIESREHDEDVAKESDQNEEIVEVTGGGSSNTGPE